MYVVIEKNVEDDIATETVRVVGLFDEATEACDWIEEQGEDAANTNKFELHEVECP